MVGQDQVVEKIFEETMVNFFSNVMETINPEIQGDLKTQNIRNIEKTATKMKIKLFKIILFMC